MLWFIDNASIYGADIQLVITAQEKKLDVVEIIILRWICGVTKRIRSGLHEQEER